MDKNNERDYESMTYDQVVAELESLVEAMESGDTPLEEMVEQNLLAKRLVRICQDKIKRAELKIQQLENSGDLTDFDPKTA